jgi:GT2 family glycosyltransferase
MFDLSIIIVSFNTKEFIKKCLESIVANTSKALKYEVIIVDNASSDGTLKEVDGFISQIPNLKILRNEKNIGFSKANNIGVKESKGRYILFLNSDTEVYKHTLDEMVMFMDYHKETGAATCFVELPSKKLDDATHRGFPTPWNSICHFSGLGKVFPRSLIFNGYHLGWKDLDKIHEIDALAGAFMLVRREAGEQARWWDEDYFFYGEDLDFCYMLKKLGWKIFFVPSAKILHYKGISSGIKNASQHLSIADKELKRKATNARFDAMKIFYKKHYQNLYPHVVTKLVLTGVDIKKVFALWKYK